MGTASRFQPVMPHAGRVDNRPSFRAWNDVMRGRQEQMASQPILSAPRMAPVFTQPALVHVRNDAGADIDQGMVLALTDLLYDAADNEDEFWIPANVLWLGDVPQRDLDANHYGAVGIAAEPIPQDEIGLCYVAGVVPALVNIGSTAHRYCEITDGDASELTSQEYGSYRLLHQPGSTGAGKKCYILLGPATEERILIGKTDAAHAEGASGTISVYDGTKGSETDTGRNVTAWNRYADLDSGAWVTCAWAWNGYDLIAGKCEA